MSEHTPTPWTIDQNAAWNIKSEARDVGLCYGALTTEGRNADAAFIVQACNAHDELVALLRDDVLPVISNYRAVHGKAGCICIICELPDMIRAALAKAGAA
jgi:hypothetical protein